MGNISWVNPDTAQSNIFTSSDTITTASTLNYATSTSTTALDGSYLYNNLYTYITNDTVEDTVKKYLEEEKEKEKKKMEKNFNFGPYNTNDIRLSVYGIAVQNKTGKWVSYDTKTKKLIDVEILNVNIEASKVFYVLPKAINQVVPGDIILHNGKPMFVETIRADGKFDVIDPNEGIAVTILPLSSPFGFDFISCIVSLTDYLPPADETNPFGNLLPFLLGNKNDNSMLALMMMMNKSDKKINPLMFMLMNNKDGNSLSTYMLMQMFMKNKKTASDNDDEGEFYIQL